MRASGDLEPFLKLKTPRIKRRATDAQFTTGLWHRQTGFKTAMIWLSVNLDFFTLSASPTTLLHAPEQACLPYPRYAPQRRSLQDRFQRLRQ
jgi:hypothetical protein